MTAGFDTGQRFGAYLLGKLIGRGGMGVVYQAQHVHLGRTVALKLLTPELSESEDFRTRFLRESRIAASIEHPGIVTVYDAGEVNGVLYLAMRYVRGTDLAALLTQRGPLIPKETLSILGQVAEALDAAHAAGLVHRDVKPANVMIEGDRCYLADFGLTKRTAETRALTEAGQFLGTVDYVAPEQIEGREVDGRADVYALGCVLFECITGSRPFPRDSQVAVIFAQLREPPPRASELRPDLPGAIDAVIQRALAKSPDERYPTCAALVAAAGQAAPTQPSPIPGPDEEAAAAAIAPTAATPGATLPPTIPPADLGLPTAPLPPSVAGLPTAPLPPPSPTGRPSRLLPIAAAAAVLIAAIVAIVVVLSSGSSEPKTTLAPVNPAGSGTPGAPETGAGPHVAGTIQVGKRPAGVVFRDGLLWVADNAGASVTRVKPDGSSRASIPVGEQPYDLASNSSSVWVANSRNDTVTRIDASTSQAGPQLPVGRKPLFLTAEEKVVYVANSGEGSVTKLDASSGASLGTIPVGNGPRGITTDSDSVWVANRDSDSVSRIAKDGSGVRTIPVGHHPVGVISRDGVAWVANEGSGTVSRIEIDTNRLSTIRVGSGPVALVALAGYVWVANRDDGTVVRVDAASGKRVDPPLDVPGAPLSLTRNDAYIWVSARAGTLTRIEP
ncbi:MAG: serine/threonine protein kinase, bacterial [Thermoleophilaceae bacterium]|nr:serine/threonine protein kinase, bacterial [Thermoleophilaceae bacterium]